MPMTVRELLAERRLRLEPIVQGDLDREIRWVHSSEMPDPGPYLRGDEVVLTAGVWTLSDGGVERFVDGLVSGGASAVGFGVSALHPALPEEFRAACAARGLTLFLVPVDIPFISIAEAHVERYVADHERPLLDTMRRNRLLMDSVGEGKGIAGILRVVQRYRPGTAYVVSRRQGLLGWAGAKPGDARVAEIRAAVTAARRETEIDGARAIPIVGRGQPDAYLVLERDEDAAPGTGAAVARPVAARAPEAANRVPDPAEVIVDQALPFIGLELQRDLAVRESERRFAAELFDLVMEGSALLPAASARLAAFGLKPGSHLVGLVGESDDPEEALERLEGIVADLGIRGLLAVKGVEVWGAFLHDRPAADLAAHLPALRDGLGPNGCLGLGSVVEGISRLRASLLEAQQACHFARRRPSERYASYADVGSHTLLLALQDEDVLRTFREAVLGPLIDYDRRRGTELMRTLEEFLESDGEYGTTAKALHVHVNTLRLRLARIESLTGRNLSELEDRIDFFIALRTRG